MLRNAHKEKSDFEFKAAQNRSLITLVLNSSHWFFQLKKKQRDKKATGGERRSRTLGHKMKLSFFSWKLPWVRWVSSISILFQGTSSMTLLACCNLLFEVSIHPSAGQKGNDQIVEKDSSFWVVESKIQEFGASLIMKSLNNSTGLQFG